MTPDSPEAATDFSALALNQIAEMTWLLLEDGVLHTGSPFHTPVIASVGQFGPAQRTVVLRHVDRADHSLICHTDRRTVKMQELAADNRMSWLIYDRERKLQVKLSGYASLHLDDEAADACWARSGPNSRTCYNTTTGPGWPAQAPPPAPLSVTGDDDGQAARENFAAICCAVNFIDWLYLTAAGHRRAFLRLEDGEWQATWVTP